MNECKTPVFRNILAKCGKGTQKQTLIKPREHESSECTSCTAADVIGY